MNYVSSFVRKKYLKQKKNCLHLQDQKFDHHATIILRNIWARLQNGTVSSEYVIWDYLTFFHIQNILKSNINNSHNLNVIL